jgi:hypothetical protein
MTGHIQPVAPRIHGMPLLHWLDNVQERGDLDLLKTKSLQTLQIAQRICAK